MSGRLLCAINVTGYRSEVHPHTLVAATAIEQRVMAMRLDGREMPVGIFEKAARGRLNDSGLAVDHDGRVLRMDAAAENLFGSHENVESAPDLRRALEAILNATVAPVEDHTTVIYGSRPLDGRDNLSLAL